MNLTGWHFYWSKKNIATILTKINCEDNLFFFQKGQDNYTQYES